MALSDKDTIRTPTRQRYRTEGTEDSMTTFKRTPTDSSYEASDPSRSDDNHRNHATSLDALILVVYITVPGLIGYGIGEWLTDGWMVWVATGIGVLGGSFLATILIPQSWRRSHHKHPAREVATMKDLIDSVFCQTFGDLIIDVRLSPMIHERWATVIVKEKSQEMEKVARQIEAEMFNEFGWHLKISVRQ